MMVSPDHERIIRAAAAAEHAYWQLVKRAAESPYYRLALMDRRIAIDAELRGGPRQPPPPPSIMEPIDTAVDRELERMRADVVFRVASWRAMRRLGGCGYLQLSLSHAAQMRRRLRKLIQDSRLTIAEFAEISGQDETTVHDHLRDGKISRTRGTWYRSIMSIAVNRDAVVLTVRRAPRGPRSQR